MTASDPLGFHHCVAGLHIGSMTPRPMEGEFGAVLSVGQDPGTVEDGIRHRHVPVSYSHLDPSQIKSAADWAEEQLVAQRTVLVRSERGKQRPALIVAVVLMRLGASYYEALDCVRRGRFDILSDFRYQGYLRALTQPVQP